jgi:NADPH:quinone reductase
MRAVLVSEFGGPDQLRLSRAADPVAGPGQARIVVHAAGVNPVDAGNRADGRWAGLRVPCILGYDVAEAHRILERRHASGKIILDVTG